MFRSLRWRLQGWHALILILVIAGFGSVLYLTFRKARFDEIDAELHAAARVLEGSLRTFPRPMLENRFKSPPFSDGHFPPPRKEDRLPGRPPQPPPPEHFYRTLSLPKSLAERHARADEAPYFAVWLANGDLLKASPAAEAVPPPDLSLDAMRGGEFQSRQRGPLREVVLLGPDETRILVGRSIDQELAELHRLAWQLVLIGLGVFALGLVGGWWLSRRAVRPIETMSATAASISASNLSCRIETVQIDDELASLGQVLNAMFDRLEAAFEQQVRFTADASHELRTPLSVLLTHAELALNRPRSADEYRETIETCLRASRRMKSIVEDLLTLSRADAGKLELRSERVDLRQIAEDCVTLLEPLAAQRAVRLVVAGEAAETAGDPDRLAQVVTNLLSNAILYNRPGGEVTLTTACEEADVVLTVYDTGPGIPAEDCPHLFERFYRVDKARSREAGGSGLGLAICQSIVQAHGGTLTVSSEVNVGSRFVVRLRRSCFTPPK